MHRSSLVALLLVATLLLGACLPPRSDTAEGTPPATGNADSSPPPATVPADVALPDSAGGTLIMPLSAQDPPTFDPALVGDVVSAFVVRQLFSGLVRLDAAMEPQPDLAASWDISDDGTTYTFTLRDNARFADGRAITSADVVYSLERATDPTLAPNLPAANYLTDIVGVAEKLAGEADTIRGVNAPDERTVALTIDQPKSFFLAKLAHPTSFVVDRNAVEAGGDSWTEQPNGSGPFVIEEWLHNELLVLQRNLNFYRDLAKLDRVRFLMGAAATNALVQYEQGDVDVVTVPAFALARVQDESNPLSQELVSVPQLSLTYVGLNTTIPPFDDPDIRRAFAAMIDRQRIAEVTLHNSVEPARGILPPGIPGYNEALLDSPVPGGNLDEVRDLFAQSSYGGTDNLPAIAAYGGGFTGTLAEVGEQEFGIEIELRDFENFGAYLSALDERNFPMYGLGWIGDYPDPENFLDLLFRTGSPQNHANYSNPEVDRLLDAAAVATDEEERWELYHEVEQIVLEDAPIIPIYHDVEHVLVKPYVEGLNVTPMGILDLSTVELIRTESEGEE